MGEVMNYFYESAFLFLDRERGKFEEQTPQKTEK